VNSPTNCFWAGCAPGLFNPLYFNQHVPELNQQGPSVTSGLEPETCG